jgi:molybdopterin-synthase adenylyltransferase
MPSMIDQSVFEHVHLSIAMTEALDDQLQAHLDKGPGQEDLAFALWRPSWGHTRLTAILQQLVLPEPGDRMLHGNVAFTPDYIQRVLQLTDNGFGIALLHSHLGPGWQGMSHDDVVAERDRLAAAVAGRTGLPLVGLTRGTDGAWSGRFWFRQSPASYARRWAATVRVVGQQLRMTYHPELLPPPAPSASQIATVSVWGEEKQADLARLRVGIIGLGSVGSIVAEALSRVGMTWLSLIDHDCIEMRNLDRTLGATHEDAVQRTPKVTAAERLIKATHTAEQFHVESYHGSLLQPEGLQRALDCDVLFSCVDRPLPRHLLNALAYAHLIPVVDGGILVKVEKGHLIHADWRVHMVGPGRPCLLCLDALRREEVALDKAGLLDDPAYIKGLGSKFNPLLSRQNVFPFSLNVASLEVLQFIGLVTGQSRIGGTGPQIYHCYPGSMEVIDKQDCAPECEYSALTASAQDLSGNCQPANSRSMPRTCPASS